MIKIRKRKKIGKCQISKKVKNMIGHKQKKVKNRKMSDIVKSQKYDRS